MSKTITCAILEDDVAAMNLLVTYVKRQEQLQLKATFADPLEAKDFLLENEIDLLIADIQLPHMNAFELINLLPIKPLVILCTGTKNISYAIKGYDIDVVHYLTKPFSHKHFEEAIQRVFIKRHVSLGVQEVEVEYTSLPQDGGMVRIHFADIIYLEAVKNYVYIHLINDENQKVRCPLQQLEDELPKSLFIRIHKSYMVSKRLIASFSSTHVKLYYLKKGLPLGRTYKDGLKTYMSQGERKQKTSYIRSTAKNLARLMVGR
ncbi:LytTR family DNA-binding domain-containing protein [Olivibacter sp. CPCC 100613]|uniref:LytR/AlgR family response regulator transcription factor n=1 Tax=Olivibacter sp. CPCC 100613 TaxID=3079931 RepID=UPI002FF531B8